MNRWNFFTWNLDVSNERVEKRTAISNGLSKKTRGPGDTSCANPRICWSACTLVSRSLCAMIYVVRFHLLVYRTYTERGAPWKARFQRGCWQKKSNAPISYPEATWLRSLMVFTYRKPWNLHPCQTGTGFGGPSNLGGRVDWEGREDWHAVFETASVYNFASMQSCCQTKCLWLVLKVQNCLC